MMFYVLLVFLILVTLSCLFLLFRYTRGSYRQPQEDPAVLLERLKAREEEITALKQSLQTEQQRVRDEAETVAGLREQLTRQETVLQQERKQNQEKLQLLQNAREQMTGEFKALANEILEQKGKSFSSSNQEQIQNLLKPLSEKIQLFEKKVEETYDRESKQRFALEKEIKHLLELNVRISEDAVNLTKALKGESKTQGIWGEVILERVLEKSGLEKGREYEVQVSLKDDSGRKWQPDVLVHLPEEKDVIIDSKVSLTAYEAYFRAEEETEKAAYLRQHIQSIRNHIKGLSEKNYPHLDGVRSLDYVLLFLPVEAAFTLAVQQDDSLFTEAFDKNIILVGPSTLLATLRTIQSIWRYEYQNKHALEIAASAGRLYDKFVGFCADLEKLGERIRQSQEAWDDARNKLVAGRGNLVGSVEKIKAMGARAGKSLPRKLLDDADDAGPADEAAAVTDDDTDEKPDE